MDEMDVFARELTPHIVMITQHTIVSNQHQFSKEERNEIKKMIDILK